MNSLDPVEAHDPVRTVGAGQAAVDAELLARLRQYDQQALLELYDLYHGPIYRFVWHMSGDRNLAADVTQEVFLLLLQPAGLLRRIFWRFDAEKGNLEGYLLGIARKIARKQLAKQRRWQTIDDGLAEAAWNSAGEGTEQRFLLERLRAAIALLPIRYREAIVLCKLEEKSYEQAAAILGCSPGTVASRISRARDLLSVRMAGTKLVAKTGLAFMSDEPEQAAKRVDTRSRS